jgi:hypothetical protein
VKLSKREHTDIASAVGPEKGIALLAEIFEAIGFDIKDEESYNLLAEHTDRTGERSSVYRGDATLHGRCWKLGEGLEVWSVLYEAGQELYYADCRPAFRGRYVHKISPWEMAEYCEDGEAVVRGVLAGGREILFELQNLTEVKPNMLRSAQLRVGLAGLACSVHVEGNPDPGPIRPAHPKADPKPNPGRRSEAGFAENLLLGNGLTPASRLAEYAEEACENDYLIRGCVLAWRELHNPITGGCLVWMYVDANDIRLELLASRRCVEGRLQIGATISATAWLQGHFLEEGEVSARYEGVDPDFVKGDFWALLRKTN